MVLDAGGDTSASLSGSLYRCMDEMNRGQVLHVISRVGAGSVEVPAWCSASGHRLLRTEARQNETLFWIKKL